MTRLHVFGILSVISLSYVAACSGGSDDTSGSSSRYDFATGPRMLPGENCLRCHNGRGSYPDAPAWTAGGTVFPTADADDAAGVSGAVVELTDRAGKKLRLTTNAAGNFYTDEPLQAPLRVALEHDGKRIEMPIEAPAGSCNACHSHPDPTGGAKGRIRTSEQGARLP